jgi:hypothetical protein
MTRILEIQKKSNQYIANLNANVVRVLERNSKDMIRKNQSQFLSHKDAEGNALIHESTGSVNLTPAYAKRTGKKKPDFFLSGDFWDKMYFTMPSMNEYFINSKSQTGKYLSLNYGKIYGIAPDNRAVIQKINDKAIINDYLNFIV